MTIKLSAEDLARQNFIDDMIEDGNSAEWASWQWDENCSDDVREDYLYEAERVVEGDTKDFACHSNDTVPMFNWF